MCRGCYIVLELFDLNYKIKHGGHKIKGDKMTEFEDKLLLRFDKIIQLLEFKNTVFQAKFELKKGEYAPDPFLMCTCHKKGKTTADEYCPIHG